MGEVVDFQKEKEKRQKSNPLDYPNEGVAPLGERMMNAAHLVETKSTTNVVQNEWEAKYHKDAIEEETGYNGT